MGSIEPPPRKKKWSLPSFCSNTKDLMCTNPRRNKRKRGMGRREEKGDECLVDDQECCPMDSRGPSSQECCPMDSRGPTEELVSQPEADFFIPSAPPLDECLVDQECPMDSRGPIEELVSQPKAGFLLIQGEHLFWEPMHMQDQNCSPGGSFLRSVTTPVDEIFVQFLIAKQDSKKKMARLYVLILSVIIVAAAVVVYGGGGGGGGGGSSSGGGGGGSSGGGGGGGGSSGGGGGGSVSYLDMLRFGRADTKKVTPESIVKNFKLKFLPGVPHLKHSIIAFVWSRGFCLEETHRWGYIGVVSQDDLKVHGLWPPNDRVSANMKFDNGKVFRDRPLLIEAINKWPNLTHFTADPYGHLSFWELEWDRHGVKSGLEQGEYMRFTLALYDLYAPLLSFYLHQSKKINELEFDPDLRIYVYTLRVSVFNTKVSYHMFANPKLMCKRIQGNKLILVGIQLNVSLEKGPGFGDLLDMSLSDGGNCNEREAIM